MTTCWWVVCFQPLSTNGERIFGFSEYLASLALMVLAWTLADTRYKFRLKTAVFPLERLSFWTLGLVGVLTLLTDLWRAESWLVPVGGFISPAIWQSFLGATFLMTFLLWVWFAFLGPTAFGSWNATRVYDQVYRVVLRGSAEELAEIAGELNRFAQGLVEHSWESGELRKAVEANKDSPPDLRTRKLAPRTSAYETLLLLGDRRFARAVVCAAPATAGQFFHQMATKRKMDLPLDTFARNLTAEALANRDSFIYHEESSYDSGLLGHIRPLTNTVYGNYELLRGLGHALDVNYLEREKWDTEQWKAFSRIVLVAFSAFARSESWGTHAAIFFRVFHDFEGAIPFKVENEDGSWWHSIGGQKTYTSIKLALDVVAVMDSAREIKVKLREGSPYAGSDITDPIVGILTAAVHSVADYRGSQSDNWNIHYGTVWTYIRDLQERDGWASRAVAKKLRRKLFDEILELEGFPNYRGAALLGFLWNVLGIDSTPRQKDCDWPLNRAVVSWTRGNLAKFVAENPRVSGRSFSDGIRFQPAKRKLIRTGTQILDRPRRVTSLVVDPIK